MSPLKEEGWPPEGGTRGKEHLAFKASVRGFVLHANILFESKKTAQPRGV